MSIKQAIEALEAVLDMIARGVPDFETVVKGRAALAALRSMPAEPVRWAMCTETETPCSACPTAGTPCQAMPAEPVGFMSEQQIAAIKDPEGERGHYIPMRKTPAGNFTLPLYTTPPPAPVLSDAEIEEVVAGLMVSADGYVRFSASLRQFARAVEAEVIRRGGGQS